MKKAITRIAAVLLAVISLMGIYPVPAQAATSPVSSDSAHTVTFTVYTKSKWSELLKTTPAKITLTQTRGTCKFTNKNGKTSTNVNNGYCWYDVDYIIYNAKGKYVNKGHYDFYKGSVTLSLKASPRQAYKYVITIKPHFARVYNSRTRSYYLGYVWTKPSRLTVKAGHDVTSMYRSLYSKMK